MKPKCEKCGKELNNRDMRKASRDYLCPGCDAEEQMKKLTKQIQEGKHKK